jgi:hypothetical protein
VAEEMAARSRASFGEEVTGMGRTTKTIGQKIRGNCSFESRVNFFGFYSPKELLLTGDTKMIVKHGQDTVGIEGNVSFFMNEKVVA